MNPEIEAFISRINRLEIRYKDHKYADAWPVPQAELITVRDWIKRESDMKAILEILGNQSLAHSDAPGDFDSKDLVNVLLILQHVAHSIAWKHYEGFTLEQKSMMAEEFGKNLRQSVTLFTGTDPHDAVRGTDGWPEIVTERL